MRASLLLAGSLLTCSPPIPGQPADAVKRFFGTVEAGDCKAAFATLAQAFRAELESRHGACDEHLEDWRQLVLERVLDTRVDGRDERAHLVRVRLRGRSIDSWIRVEAEDRQWRIVSM
ncbi:hypothetical protein [Nannocystis radixulma]|uniref:DUF3828 domain-containing protein n=1 Tax=Nannocystis radixulma TaxID=2995305 RepID=A0ABT5BEP0_9BACT|nr:hypothetical protein [Nannocystis radixulma]MDC0672613.1 hypothetical protein [Nannocystis radixulma]